MLSDEELLMVLRWQIQFDRDQKAAEVDCFASSRLRRELEGTGTNKPLIVMVSGRILVEALCCIYGL